jgi:hypothetical protein
MAKIGLVPMAAKPAHRGHQMLIELAAKENDEVHLYVSTSDRDNISGAAMAKVWRDQLEPTLPGNVTVTYGGSPVGNVFKELGKANEDKSPDTFSVYSDPTDLKQNFPGPSLAKYAGNLLADGRIKLRAVSRSSTVNVSGTQMRQWLASGDKVSFVKHLPKGVDAASVWDALKATQPKPAKVLKKPTAAEGLLRSYVRLLLGS